MRGGQMGALVIRVKRGIDLAVRDFYSSDPYVEIAMGEQKHTTRVIDSNCNPEWNEELTFSVSDPFLPIKLTVFDHGIDDGFEYNHNALNKYGIGILGQDTWSRDDEMGEAEIDIKPYLQCMEVELGDVPEGTVVRKVQPNRTNCLAEESRIVWMDNAKILQDMTLRLKNVEKGEIQIQIEWVHLPETARAIRHLDTFH